MCGPTVYNYAHIGNARPVVVFDLLFRLLRETYGARAVLFGRYISDVDDKINQAAIDQGVDFSAIKTVDGKDLDTSFVEQMRAVADKLYARWIFGLEI